MGPLQPSSRTAAAVLRPKPSRDGDTVAAGLSGTLVGSICPGGFPLRKLPGKCLLVERALVALRFGHFVQVPFPAMVVESIEHPRPLLAHVVTNRLAGPPQGQNSSRIPLVVGPLGIGYPPAAGIGEPAAEEKFFAGGEQFVKVADQFEELVRRCLKNLQIARPMHFDNLSLQHCGVVR